MLFTARNGSSVRRSSFLRNWHGADLPHPPRGHITIVGLAVRILVVILAIPAIILAMLGLGDIRRSQGQLVGCGLAIAGIVTSLVGNLVLVHSEDSGSHVYTTTAISGCISRMRAHNTVPLISGN